MKKIPTIFERDWNGDKSRVVDVPNPKAQWVFDGEGWPTKKLDGTSCMVKDGRLFKRRELREGDAMPANFTVADHDEEIGKKVGWVPVGDGAEDKWHIEAFFNLDLIEDGTYELVGPKIQGNPEKFERHTLVFHGADNLIFDDWRNVPRTFEGLRQFLKEENVEGIVWHHEDGTMAKIKKRDFGSKR